MKRLKLLTPQEMLCIILLSPVLIPIITIIVCFGLIGWMIHSSMTGIGKVFGYEPEDPEEL